MSELLKRLEGRAPKIAIILGSSLGSFADAVKDAVAHFLWRSQGLSRSENFRPCR